MVVRSVEAGRLELNLAKRSGVAALTDLYLPSDNRHAPCPALSSHRGWKERSPFIGSREKQSQNWIRLIALPRNFSRTTAATSDSFWKAIRRATTVDVHRGSVSCGTLNSSRCEPDSAPTDNRGCKCESFARNWSAKQEKSPDAMRGFLVPKVGLEPTRF